MKYHVVYFTRTNTCQRIAAQLASRLSCELVQITDSVNWKGLVGFFRAGYYSANDKPVEIEVHGNVDGADEYILVAPLWAGGIAPAARDFLKSIPREKVHLVVSSIGNHVRDRTGFRSVHDITIISRNQNKVIDMLVNKFMKDNV